MSMSQALDRAAQRSVPCPRSGHPADEIADAVTCPHCGQWTIVEQDPWGVWNLVDHQSSKAVDRAIYVLAVVVRQQVSGHPPVSSEPDVIDLAHAAELLAALTDEPQLVMDLATKVRPRARHAAACLDADGRLASCVCATGEPL